MNSLKVKAHCLALGVALLTLAAGTANADPVHVEGETQGCFNCTAPPVFTTSATLSGSPSGTLTFEGTDFEGDTRSNPTQWRNINLGSFNVTSTNSDYSGNFSLFVDFYDPTGISPHPVYSALVEGIVRPTNDNLGVDIVFDDDNGYVQKHFTFQYLDAHQSIIRGNFDLRVYNSGATLDGPMTLMGQIRGSQSVPEPGSLALLLPGFAMAGLMIRRRRQTSL